MCSSHIRKSRCTAGPSNADTSAPDAVHVGETAEVSVPSRPLARGRCSDKRRELVHLSFT